MALNSKVIVILLILSTTSMGKNPVCLDQVGYQPRMAKTVILMEPADRFSNIDRTNGLSISFVTGFGTLSPLFPHNRILGSDDSEEPIPGFLVGGPNGNLQDATLRSLFDDNTPPALCYTDHYNSYASNETAINWNAPLVFLAGYLNGRFSSLKQ